jgi:hypothetical protein
MLSLSENSLDGSEAMLRAFLPLTERALGIAPLCDSNFSTVREVFPHRLLCVDALATIPALGESEACECLSWPIAAASSMPGCLL